jgi:hypothetical protein
MSGTVSPTILDVVTNPDIWGKWFKDGATWRPWFTFLRVLFGLSLDDDDLALYRACTGRTTPPVAGFVEVWLICGRRAGKSFILALIACFLAVFKDWSEYLVPGESAAIKIVATDRRQARVIFRYAVALLTQVPALASLVVRQPDEEIELSNGITIEIATASYRSIRGYTILALLIDEIAFLRTDETSANPDTEILTAGRAAQATLQGHGMLLTAGSPYARRGEQYRAWRAHHANDNSSVLVWQAPTRTMNRTVPQSFIDEQMERDPEAGAAEYMAKFRSDLADYIPREIVDSAVVLRRYELPPVPGIQYVGAIDTSGGTSDAQVLVITHAAEDGVVVLDAVLEARAPFVPETEAARAAELCRLYGVQRIFGDKYGGQWPVGAFARYGIALEGVDRTKSDFYRDLLPLLSSGKVELLDNPRLVNQLAGLERRTARSGKDSIDHPPGAHDDIANAAAIGLVLASTSAAPALWHRRDLFVGEQPAEWGAIRCNQIFATAAVDDRGIVIVYWASGSEYWLGPRTLLIDFHHARLTPTLFGEVAARLQGFADRIAAIWRHPVVAGIIFTTSSLKPHAEAAGLLAEDGDFLLRSREGLLLTAAGQIGLGNVKITDIAAETAMTLPLPLVEIRAGAPSSAAGDAALLGIAVTLPHEMKLTDWAA